MILNTQVKKVVVVGGGSSGWIMADRLAKQLGNAVQVELIESPDVKPVAVGEGTFPTMRKTLKMLGIPEDLFLKECDATFKQTIQFVNWLDAPVNGENQSFHHLFNSPRQCEGGDLSPYWLLNRDVLGPYDQSVSEQSHICNRGYGPKAPNTPEYEGVVEYAYHLDAVKFVSLLRRWGVEKLGVTHHIGHVEQVHLTDSGSIKSLTTREGGVLEGDLFIDCTGFSAYLIGDVLGVPFVDRSDTLFVDRAMAIQVPYQDPEQSIACGTISTAQKDGWIWDIGLQTRRGIGYVYSSSHVSDDGAEKVLRQYVGSQSDDISVKPFRFRVGHREKLWHKNCIAVGFSGYFVEPLEATALFLVEAAAIMLADIFPYCSSVMEQAERKYNESMLYRGDRIFDFIKLHYYLSRRDDSDFWISNRDKASVSDRLLDDLEAWKYRMPSVFDYRSSSESHSLESYKWILYGMEYQTDLSLSKSRYQQNQSARDKFEELSRIIDGGIDNLPKHRALIDGILKYGFSR